MLDMADTEIDTNTYVDSRLELEFIVTGFVPADLPTAITVKALGGRSLSLTGAEFWSLIEARRKLERYLSEEVGRDSYRSLSATTKAHYLADEYRRTDQEAIRALYAQPGFRARISGAKGGA